MGKINNIDLGQIQDEQWELVASIDAMPFWGDTTNNVWLTEMDGPLRRVSIKGLYINTIVADLQSWVDSIEALPNIADGQTDTVVFAGNKFPAKTINVAVEKFLWKGVSGDACKVEYTLQLVEGSF